MTIEEWIKAQEEDDFMFRLANLSPRRTGLSPVVWLENSGKGLQKPRIWFSNSIAAEPQNEAGRISFVPISIDSVNPEILVEGEVLKIPEEDVEMIKIWIVKNYDPLTLYWEGERDFYEIMYLLKKV